MDSKRRRRSPTRFSRCSSRSPLLEAKPERRCPPYMFTCPAVQTQVSRLLWRHLSFLVALCALQTLALAVRPNLPDWWNTDRRGTPFEIALLFLCLGLGYAQVFTNRRLLDRAHRKFSS